MRRRWKIIAAVLIIIFIFPLIGHVILSNPTNLPIGQGSHIYVGTATYLGIFTVPLNISDLGNYASYAIHFSVSMNSTISGAWKSSSPIAVEILPSSIIGKIIIQPLIYFTKSGIINATLDPGNYFIAFLGSASYWYTTVTVTRAIQLCPENPVSSVNFGNNTRN